MRSQPASINLRSLNLNLLPILERLLTTRSVTRTAAALHMSQPAVSDALARLRRQFRDDLLVRAGREMALTPLARDLLPHASEIVHKVEAMMRTPAFDPRQMDREFVVATADPVIMTVGGMLCRLMLEEAPLARVRFVELSRRDEQRLRGMEVDLVIAPEGYLREERLHEARLYQEAFVCIARHNHPQIGKRLTPAIYRKLAHISFRTGEDAQPSMEAHLIGLEEHDVLLVPNFLLLPLLVEQTDAIALVQARVAERFAETADVQVYDPPVPIPPLDVCMYWSPGHDQDPGHQWFRQQLQTAAASPAD